MLEAAGSVLTNKYAEGYPGKRYYGGCEFVDVAESLAIARAKELFGAEHANVQPHSGAQANMAVYLTLLKPGDTVLGMNLAHGGHLTHGHPGELLRQVLQDRPLRRAPRTTSASTTTRCASLAPRAQAQDDHRRRQRLPAHDRLRAHREIAHEVGALMADMAHIAGLVAAGLHPSPVPHADFVTTTTHKTLRGPRGGMILCRARHAKSIDKRGLPRRPGRAADARHRRQGGVLPEALEPAFGLPAADREERARLAAASRPRGFGS